jgi:hypothetical protein
VSRAPPPYIYPTIPTQNNPIKISKKSNPIPNSARMAWPGVFGYDDYIPYYYGNRREQAVPRNAGGFFTATGDVDPSYQPARVRRRARNAQPAASRAVSVPVRVVGSDTEPEVATVPVKQAPSVAEATARVQAAARGFLARKAVRALRAVEREAEEVAGRVAREPEALHADARARIRVGDELMRLLLRVDAVRGARDYRRRVARQVLKLQDAVDALEQSPVAEEGEAEAAGRTPTVDNAVAAADLPGSAENNGDMDDKTAAETATEVEVVGDRAAADGVESANLGGDEPADEDAEGHWELAAEEPEATLPTSPHTPQPQEPAEQQTIRRPAEADTKKLMEMVAALCEQSAQQCAIIGALVERVDALERAVWRAEKLGKEEKGSNHIKCYCD